MKSIKTLLKIEGKLSIRDMNMCIFAIIMPLVAAVILGIIYGDKEAFSGAYYSVIEESFGALSTISICAGGLMGLPIVISDYRERKILKRFKITPISPLTILFVQLLIYTIYSLISVISLGAVLGLFFNFKFKGSYVIFLAGWLLVLVSMLSIGMLVGGISKNSKQASIIASILYFPMLIFSGATLPYDVMPKMLQKAADFMPLTQGIKILKAASLNIPLENVVMPIIIMISISIICILASVKLFKWE